MEKIPPALAAVLLLAAVSCASPLPAQLEFSAPPQQENPESPLPSLSFEPFAGGYEISSSNSTLRLFSGGKMSESAKICSSPLQSCPKNLSVYLIDGGDFKLAGIISFAKNDTPAQEGAPPAAAQIFSGKEKNAAALPLPGYWPVALSALAVILITAYHFMERWGR